MFSENIDRQNQPFFIKLSRHNYFLPDILQYHVMLYSGTSAAYRPVIL